jgi:hypothetical protein
MCASPDGHLADGQRITPLRGMLRCRIPILHSLGVCRHAYSSGLGPGVLMIGIRGTSGGNSLAAAIPAPLV